jgi:hypothetical protein
VARSRGAEGGNEMSRIWLLVVAALFVAVGCGGASGEVSSGKGKGKKGGLGKISSGTRCETGSNREAMVDLNQDGTPDVRKVYAPTAEGEMILCREADLNFDGVKDIFIFFDDDGRPKQDEVDLDYDGTIDIVSIYASGKVVKQELDTNSDGMIDRVRILQDEVPTKVEGDTDGDGRVDYWEY